MHPISREGARPMTAGEQDPQIRELLARLAARLDRIEDHLGLPPSAVVDDRRSETPADAPSDAPADALADAPSGDPADAASAVEHIRPRRESADLRSTLRRLASDEPVDVQGDVQSSVQGSVSDTSSPSRSAPPPPPPPPPAWSDETVDEDGPQASHDGRAAAAGAAFAESAAVQADDGFGTPGQADVGVADAGDGWPNEILTEEAAAEAAPPSPPSHAPPAGTAPTPPAPKRSSMEELIGGNWAAWGGAAILFLAALFAIKIAVDRGWWGTLAPPVKFAVIAAGGLAMVAAGEVAFRRIGRRASVGLFGAGLGILYLDAFAAFQFWDLVPGGGAFLLMGIVAIGGFALTYRTGSLTIGVLSIVGGFLTPLLLHGQSGRDVELLTYLTVLLGISLGLAATNRHAFWPMRFLALIATGLVMFFWLMSPGGSQWIIGLVFMAIWWTMVLAESLVAALRGHSRRGNVVMTLVATAAWASAGTWLLSGAGAAGTDWTGVFTLCIGALAAAAALQFGPGLDGLRARPRTPMDVLAVALWVQAAILLTTAVALHFDGAGRAVAWLVIAVGAIETGRRLPSRGLDIFGLVVGALALVDVCFGSWIVAPELLDEITTIGPVTITGWSIISLLAMAALSAAAVRLRDRRPTNWQITPVVLTALAAVFWLVWWQIQAAPSAITFGWLGGAALLLAVSPLARRQRALGLGGLVIVAAIARWVTVDLVGRRLDPSWDPGATPPFLNGPTITAVVIGGLGWWMVRLLTARRRELLAQTEVGSGGGGDGRRSSMYAERGFAAAAQCAALGIVLVGLLALSFDADRIVEGLFAADAGQDWLVGHVRQNALTALWAVGALALALLGRVSAITGAAPGSPALPGREEAQRPMPILAAASALILAGCTIKFLVFDTLAWVVNFGRDGVDGLAPMVNVQMFTGVVIAVTALMVRRWIHRPRPADAAHDGVAAGLDSATAWIPVGAAIVLLWALTFEIDRVLTPVIEGVSVPEAAMHPWLLRVLWWTVLWTAGGVALSAIGRWRRSWTCVPAGAVMVAGSAFAWLGYATLGWRFTHPPLDLPVVGNLQFMVGVVVAAGAIGVALIHRSLDAAVAGRLFREVNVPGTVVATLSIIGLWLGTLELDRALADDPKLRLASFSVWWGLYAIGLIAAGFARRSSLARFAGLGLLAFTAIKVVAVDMAGIDNIWRVVSSAAIGLLLLATSVVYARFGASVKAEQDEHASDGGSASETQRHSDDDGPR
ncbi:MAG: DUF2339 domain-containing protein [Phycisphaerales bacterium]